MKAYKLLRIKKDGNLYPLFINKTVSTPIGECILGIMVSSVNMHRLSVSPILRVVFGLHKTAMQITAGAIFTIFWLNIEL